MCIILQNFKRSPNPHLCSNFQENNRFKTHACNCLIIFFSRLVESILVFAISMYLLERNKDYCIVLPEQFIVISLTTNTQLRFHCISLHQPTVSAEVIRKQVRVMTVRNTA